MAILDLAEAYVENWSGVTNAKHYRGGSELEQAAKDVCDWLQRIDVEVLSGSDLRDYADAFHRVSIFLKRAVESKRSLVFDRVYRLGQLKTALEVYATTYEGVDSRDQRSVENRIKTLVLRIDEILSWDIKKEMDRQVHIVSEASRGFSVMAGNILGGRFSAVPKDGRDTCLNVLNVVTTISLASKDLISDILPDLISSVTNGTVKAEELKAADRWLQTYNPGRSIEIETSNVKYEIKRFISSFRP